MTATTPVLDQVEQMIRNRLDELRPLVEEYEKLRDADITLNKMLGVLEEEPKKKPKSARQARQKAKAKLEALDLEGTQVDVRGGGKGINLGHVSPNQGATNPAPSPRPRRYSKKQRADALKLAKATNPTQASKKTGISATQIRNWLKEAKEAAERRAERRAS